MKTYYKGWTIRIHKVGDTDFAEFEVMGGRQPTFSNMSQVIAYIDGH